MNIDPQNVIRVVTLSIKSAVAFPGLIPGIKAFWRFKYSAYCFGFTNKAVYTYVKTTTSTKVMILDTTENGSCKATIISLDAKAEFDPANHCAIWAGKNINACAKIIGITPAAFTFNGM